MLRIVRTLWVFLAAVPVLYGQLNGRLTGTVLDPTGASVPDAKVELYLAGGKAPLLTATTNTEGLFDFIAVRPDLYMLVVEHTGFAKYSQGDVKVDPVRQTELPAIQLTLAGSVQMVDVTAAVQVVNVSSAEIASTVTQAQITHLPVLDRQIGNLFVLQAGVSYNGSTPTVINGMRPSYSNLTFEGINFQDTVRTNDLDNLPNRFTIAQVSEFTVSTSNVNPTIGGAASTITLLAPSGSNALHGSGYWYNRNSFLSANNWFNNKNNVARPFLNLNQIGGSLGGAVVKDKLFFFGNYEAFRRHQSSPRSSTILTPTARQGILRYGAGGAQQFDVLKASGVEISPFMKGLLDQVPTTANNNSIGDGVNTTGYSFNARNNIIRDNVTAKVDYNLTTRNTFAASYSWNRELVDRPDATPFFTFVPPVYNDNSARLLALSWRTTPRPTLTNELRGGFNLSPLTFKNRQQFPAFFVTGMNFSSPLNSTYPEGRYNNSYQLQDNANWIHGKHSVQFGFQTTQLRSELYGYGGTLPSYGLGLSPTSKFGFSAGSIPGATSTDLSRANSLLISLAGIVSSSTQSFNPTSRTSGFVNGAPYRNHTIFNTYALYALDNIKLRRNLTLTLGLRWDYMAPADDRDSLFLQPRLIDNNLVATLLGNATLDFTGNSVGRPLYKKDLNNFAPNVSLAWDVFGDGKTSLRSGFNIAYLNDNTINDSFNVGVLNNGLNTTVARNNLNERTDAPPAIAAPPFKVPLTALDNFNLTPSAPPAQAMWDPNLAMPYVEQWTFAIEREMKGFIAEARYVGNHVVKVFRQIDFNQVNVNQGGFLQDFTRARNNLFLSQNAGKTPNPQFDASIPGSQPLTFFPLLPGGGALTNATVQGLLRSGEAGSLAQTYQSNLYFPSNMPGFSYFPNPLVLYSSAVTNLSNSSYNGLQLEIRKHTRSGFQFQANYTFSKSLTDALAMRQIDAQLDNNNPRLERARANFDQAHAFKLNHYIPLPFGPGHRWGAGGNPVMRRAAEGWGLSGFVAFYSGNPVAIYSARGTLNRGARSGTNTVDTTLTHEQLSALTGVFKTGTGVYWFDPSHIGPDTHGVAPDGAPPFNGQVFFNPAPGTLGSLQRRSLNGPWYRNYDFSVSKETRITERHSIEFNASFFNVFNHPSFFINDQNVNSNNFGVITSTYGPRIVQFGLYYRF